MPNRLKRIHLILSIRQIYAIYLSSTYFLDIMLHNATNKYNIGQESDIYKIPTFIKLHDLENTSFHNNPTTATNQKIKIVIFNFGMLGKVHVKEVHKY